MSVVRVLVLVLLSIFSVFSGDVLFSISLISLFFSSFSSIKTTVEFALLLDFGLIAFTERSSNLSIVTRFSLDLQRSEESEELPIRNFPIFSTSVSLNKH